MSFYDHFKHTDIFSVIDAAFLICDLYPPPADHIYPSEWATTHNREEIARAQSLVTALMDWIYEGKDVKRQWNMDDASSLALSREDIANWCTWAGLAPQFLLQTENNSSDASQPSQKGINAYLTTIMAMSKAITGQEVVKPYKTAGAVLHFLAARNIEAPVSEKTLALWLTKAPK